MHILTVGNMYPPHHQGGYEQDWAAGVAALRAAGHQVDVLVSGHRERDVANTDEPGVHRELRWYWHEHEFPKRSLRECRAIERHNADVFARRSAGVDLVSWWPMGGLSMSLVRRAHEDGLPGIGVVYDDWMIYGPRVDQWHARWARFRRLGLGVAARWLFASDSVRRAARNAVTNLADTDLLAPGLDEVFLDPAPPRDWTWDLIAPGRLDPRKGLATAVEALALVPEARLTIIGSGDERHAAELHALAERIGVHERFAIEPPRPRPELVKAYANADAVVFPVEWAEPFGLVPLEAMGVGRPVVATGRGGSGEFLRDGENALLFEAGNARELAAALQRLAGDAGLRTRLRDGGLATAPLYARSKWNQRVVEEHELRANQRRRSST